MKKNYTEYGTRWITKVEYYDIENGEQITPTTAKKQYKIISKTKTYELNYAKTKGIVTIANICGRDKQGRLFE